MRSWQQIEESCLTSLIETREGTEGRKTEEEKEGGRKRSHAHCQHGSIKKDRKIKERESGKVHLYVLSPPGL